MAESLVTSPISQNTQGLWEFFHYRKVERMEAKMLTCICKGDDCNLNPGSWTVTRLLSFFNLTGWEEFARIILPTRRTSSGWNQIWTRYVKVFVEHVIWTQCTKSWATWYGKCNKEPETFSLQRVSWIMKVKDKKPQSKTECEVSWESCEISQCSPKKSETPLVWKNKERETSWRRRQLRWAGFRRHIAMGRKNIPGRGNNPGWGWKQDIQEADPEQRI